MGCTSSKQRFRNAFDSTCEALRLDLAPAHASKPRTTSPDERAQLLAAAQALADAEDSDELHTGGQSSVSCLLLLRCAEKRWLLSGIHAFHCLWPARCTIALAAQRGDALKATIASDRLGAWEVQTWMTVICEGFHVLALLEDTKSLPKDAQKAFTALGKVKRAFPVGQFPATAHEIQLVLSGGLAKAFQKCASASVQPKHLTTSFLRQLEAQMPGTLSGTNGPGLPVSSVPSALVKGAADYWRTASGTKGLALSPDTNPLATASTTADRASAAPAGKDSSVSPPSRGCCGGGSPELCVPLLGLVEWLSLRQAFSCRGPDDNPALYTSSLPDAEADMTAPPSSPSAVPPKGVSTLQRLAWVLRRLYELESALATGALPHAERAALTEEKSVLEKEIEALFMRVTEGHPEMVRQNGRDDLYKALSLADVFPLKTVHDGISDCAYDSATGLDVERARSDVSSIQNVWRFRLYLTAYLALTDLYGDVVTRGGVEQAGDAVGPLNFDTFLPVLRDTHARAPALLETIPVAGDQADDDVGRIISLFQHLAKVIPGDERSDHVVQFAALCKFVADRLVALHTVRRPTLRPLEDLRQELVIAEDKETRELEACAHHLREALAPLAEQRDGNLSQTTLVDTLVERTALFTFTYSASEAASEAILFSTLVERTIQPAAGATASSPSRRDTTIELTTPTTSPVASPSASASSSWLALVCMENMPIFANMVAYSLFATTTVFRCVDDTKPSPTQDAAADGARFSILDGDTALSFEWFLAALTYIADAFQQDLAALVANARSVLEARYAMRMGMHTQEDASPFHAHRLSAADAMENDSDGANGVFEPIAIPDIETVPSTLLPVSSAPHVTRAFMDMAHLNARSRGTSEQAHQPSRSAHPANRAGVVLLRDLAYVCAFNFTRTFFGEEPLLWLFFSSDAYSPRETRQLDADDAAVRQLLASMPLRDETQAYAEFFALTGGARAVCLEDVPLHDGEVAARVFCAALYERYKETLLALKVPEEALLELCRRAIERVGTVVPDASGDVGGVRRLLFAKDYQRFLQYIAGALLAHSTYDALSISGRSEVLGADGQPVKVVDTAFVRRLLFFLDHGVDGFDGSLDAADVFDELLQRDLDLYGGAVSLQSASVWYGQLRASLVAPCALDWWARCGGAIPWTQSEPHCTARRALESDLAVAMAAKLGVPMSDVNCDEPWSSLADGYMSRDVVAGTLEAQYPDLYWAATVMHVAGFVPPASLDDDNRTEAERASAAVWWSDWVRVCVERTNALVARDDLGDSELHVRDLRRLLAYMHHHATVVLASAEAEKELRAMRGAAAKTHNVDAPSKRCCYSDADFQSVLTAQLARLLGPSLGADALAAAVDALKLYGAAHPGEEVNHDTVAHLIASALVQHTENAASADVDMRREEDEAKRLKEFECEVFLGTNAFNESRAPCGTYWERLRLILPSGQSQKHRRLRREIFERMDVRHRGFLTMAEIYQGALDVLQLQRYRADVLPVLFRAFFATKDSAQEEGGAGSDVVLLDADGDRILLSREFRMFLGYVYRYMEIYFMFDVLTASNRVDERTLHVLKTDELPLLAKGKDSTGITHTSTPVLESTLVPRGEDEEPYTPDDALFLVASAPYRLTTETTNLPKEVSQSQFANAHRVLRHWGVRVCADEVESTFQHISRRCREQGAMYFTAFAIWASERNLRPEGYSHSHTVG